MTINKVTWSGGHTPTGEAAVFQFVADPGDAKTYAFNVRQTYSDGSVVDWSGPEGADTPAPQITAKTSLGGGGSTLATVDFVIAILALVAGAVALLMRAGGGRELA